MKIVAECEIRESEVEELEEEEHPGQGARSARIHVESMYGEALRVSPRVLGFVGVAIK